MAGTHTGELAALGTALSWSFTYVLFTVAARQIGPDALNRLRLAIALGFLMLAHLFIYGEPFPLDAEPVRWGWLSLSGVVGFAIADAMLFRALFFLGAQRTSLLMALVPVISTLLAWVGLAETLTPVQIFALLITVGGIAWVIWYRKGGSVPLPPRAHLAGVLYGIGAAIAQSLRYIFSKQGMSGGFPILSANIMQIMIATITLWLLTTLSGEVRSTINKLFHPRPNWATVSGAFTGPFLGVTLSLLALQLAPVGIASTLMALSPILLLPISRIVFGEPMRARTITGTVLAMVGVTLIFMS
ncbi:MAG: DMT family transporter [Candidatus Bipolaricaulota bacterium]|nr:DMT family transporter [Candidatus Bipolaricaulota bacterium]